MSHVFFENGQRANTSPARRSRPRSRGTLARGKVRPLGVDAAPSKGPAEKKAGEFEHYSAADLDVKTLLALVKGNHAIVENVCIPRYFLVSDRARTSISFSPEPVVSPLCVRAGILVTRLHTGETPLIHLPPDMPAILRRCQRRGKRFVFFNAGLYWGESSPGHANVLIFDVVTRTIERYEPAGLSGVIGLRSKHGLSYPLKSLLQRKFPGWKYVGAEEMPIGAQSLGDSFDGMCVTFALYYTLLRLSNPESAPLEIYEHILSEHEKGVLKSNILRLNKFSVAILSRLKRGQLANVRTANQRNRSGGPTHFLWG